MKYNSKYIHLEKRTIRKFAWFPIKCKEYDITHIRWLETVEIEQKWYAFGDNFRISLFGGYWSNERFV